MIGLGEHGHVEREYALQAGQLVVEPSSEIGAALKVAVQRQQRLVEIAGLMVPEAEAPASDVAGLNQPGLPELMLHVQVRLHDVRNEAGRTCCPDVAGRNIGV